MAQEPFGLHQRLLAREIGVLGPQEGAPYQRSLHFPVHYAGKLSVSHTYNGHSGCVNRLSWNSDGSLLVSGSDDRRAIIWHHPEVERTPLALSTEHRANIFGVQFLPCTGDRRVVTGAMDDTVQLHDLEASPAAHIPRPGSAGRAAGGVRAQPPIHRRVASSAHLQSVMPRTKVYFSHKDRVKDVRVEPMNPHNFWSGGEDGVVRQYDTRQPNQDKWESPTVLVQVRDGHKTIQVKSLDINKAHPHLLAVAGSDPYIRLYDRRKLSTGSWQRRGATPALMALAPPHLPLAAAARHGRSHATFVAFSNRGDKLVTTYHADHAYCFDITAGGDLSALFPDPAAARGVGIGAAAPPAAGGASALLLPQRQQSVAPSGRQGGEVSGSGEAAARRDSGGGSSGGSGSSSPLSPRAEEAKARGNSCMFERNWTAAVVAFTDALHWSPAAPVLYAQRAEALLGRGWVGDAAMALRDCDTAIGLDEAFSRAYLRRIYALQALQQFQCALTAVDEYQRRFPGRAADDVVTLAVSLRAAVEERRRLYEARRQQQDRRRAQRAAALARVQGRVDSPARPMPSGAAAAGAGASGSRGAAAAAAVEAAAAATVGAAAAVEAVAVLPPAAAVEAAAAGGSTDAEMEDSEVYGPPRPPPYDSLEEEGLEASGVAAAAPASAEEAATAAPDTLRDQGAGAGQVSEGAGAAAGAGAEQVTPARPAAAASVVEAAAAGPSRCREHAARAQSEPRQPPQETSGVSSSEAKPGEAREAAAAAEQSSGPSAATGTDGHERAAAADTAAVAGGSAGAEATADAAVAAAGAAGRGRPPETASDEEGPARRFLRNDDEEEEDEEEEEEEAPEEEEDEDDDTTDVESLPGEEDPDMELFLQYYSRVLDMAGASASASGSARAPASARHHGHHAGASTSAAAGAGGSASTAAGGGGGGRRIRGAWDGTPGGRRMLQRYVGHCNVQTDIKEVGFIGSDDAVVAAGSDCGRVFLYDAASGAVLRALPADEDVANCVQCHPSLPVIATSGIETVVRLWSPTDALPSPAAVRELAEELDAVVGRNQERMKEGPSMLRASALQQALQENPQLWQLLMSQLYGRGAMGARGRPGGGAAAAAAGPAAGAAEEPGGDDDDDDEGHPEVSCRMA